MIFCQNHNFFEGDPTGRLRFCIFIVAAGATPAVFSVRTRSDTELKKT